MKEDDPEIVKLESETIESQKPDEPILRKLPSGFID